MRLVRELETDMPFGAGLRLGPGLNIKRGHWTNLAQEELKPTLFDTQAKNLPTKCDCIVDPAPMAFSTMPVLAAAGAPRGGRRMRRN
jgi:hypothetical protein